MAKKPNFNPNKQLGGSPNNLIFAIIAFVVMIVLITWVNESVRNVKTDVPYSKFLEWVEADQVKEVVVDKQEVRGILKDQGATRFETVIAETPVNWELLKKHGVAVKVISPDNQASFWLFFLFLPFLVILALGFLLYRQTRGGGNGGGGGGAGNIFNLGKSKARMFMPAAIKETFASVAGADEAKEELKEVVDFLRNPGKFSRLGARIPRGVLLVGAPGNGKTLLAKAVAGEANCPFFSISGSDFIEVFVGVGAARVRDLFAQARKHSPSIIFIDEIDAVGRHRGTGMGGGNDEREQTLNQLLTEMDGFQTGEGSVIVIAATNRVDILDKALLRPGRFDRRVEVPYPDLKSRVKILEVHAKNVKIDPSVDLAKIARGTPAFSGADLANLVNEAALNASKYDQEVVHVKDFEEARDKVMLGKEIKSITLTEEDRKVTAYHEAGHALIRLLMPVDTDPLHKITIIPRGRALGVTHFLPEREKYTSSKEEMTASIMAAVGGRCAEEIVFGKQMTGAGSDFQSATAIARDMVCKYGMSPEIGIATYSQGQYDFPYSQKTAEQIDAAVGRILHECYVNSTKLLTDKRDMLDKLALTLFEKETMYAGEVYELLGITPREEHLFN